MSKTLSALLLLTTAANVLFATDTVRASDAATSASAHIPSFQHDVMAVLSKAGCNMGTCHGNANGKGGLKFSLRGQNPQQDYLTLTRQVGARRASIVDPETSLLLLKPLMLVPHQGGRRFASDSSQFRIIRDWISAGMPADRADAPQLVRIAVEPEHQTIYAPETAAEIRATAVFDDGRERDVTELSVFESSSTFVSVSATGLATAERAGLTTITVRYLDQQLPVRMEFVPERPDFVPSAPRPVNFIDELIFAQLQRLKINPSAVCDDTVFVRRAYLDLTGLLPTADQAQAFVASADPNKRSKLVDTLLGSPEFVEMQALRWSDLLRVEEKTLDRKGVEVFHGWIRDCFATNKPLNVMAQELLAARGSTYKVPPSNFYRALRVPESRAEAVAQVFLGIRLQCAKCHNHPFDRWTQEDYYGWSNFFSRIDYKIIENKRRDKNDKHEFNGEQIVLLKNEGDIKNPATGEIAGLRYLGDQLDLKTSTTPSDTKASTVEPDRLQKLAEWMASHDNQRFAATQANRIWYQLMGRGIVDPIDDFRSTNPPVNSELLNALTAEFRKSNFDVRHLMRVIMASNVYQLSSTTNDTNSSDNSLFSHTVPRRLTAEQTLDAIGQTLGVPIKFGGHDLGIKAVQLPGVRNGGHRYSPPEIGDRFLALFGKPSRLLTCECERTNGTTLAQTFEMVSGDLIDELLRSNQGRITQAIDKKLSEQNIVTDLYWSALSRTPSKDELAAATDHIRSSPSQRRGLEDVAWALVNSNEFLFRR